MLMKSSCTIEKKREELRIKRGAQGLRRRPPLHMLKTVAYKTIRYVAELWLLPCTGHNFLESLAERRLPAAQKCISPDLASSKELEFKRCVTIYDTQVVL